MSIDHGVGRSRLAGCRRQLSDGRSARSDEIALAVGTIGVRVYSPGDGRKRLDYKDFTSLAARVSPPPGEPVRWPPGRILEWEGFTALWNLDMRANR